MKYNNIANVSHILSTYTRRLLLWEIKQTFIWFFQFCDFHKPEFHALWYQQIPNYYNLALAECIISWIFWINVHLKIIPAN